MVEYMKYPTTVRRGIYPPAELMTLKFEQTRRELSELVGAKKEETLFVSPANLHFLTDKFTFLDIGSIISRTRVSRDDFKEDILFFNGRDIFAMGDIVVLFGKSELLEGLSPFEFGGDMIESVCFKNGTTFTSIPNRFEAGTPNISSLLGLGEAAKYIKNNYEATGKLFKYAKDELKEYIKKYSDRYMTITLRENISLRDLFNKSNSPFIFSIDGNEIQISPFNDKEDIDKLKMRLRCL